MALTDLTGTAWKFNQTIEWSSSFYYNVNFNAFYDDNGVKSYNSATSLYMDSYSSGGGVSNCIVELEGQDPEYCVDYVAISSPVPYGATFYMLRGDGLYNFAGTMMSETIYEGVGTTTMTLATTAYSLDYIVFTGGTDVTNSSLISWMQANATQQEIETEYTLRINGTVTDEYDGHKIKYIHYNGEDYKIKQLPQPIRAKASVSGLGNSDPSSQVYTKDLNFPSSFEEWTDGEGNVFIKIPTMYRKIDATSNGQITAFTMATYQDTNDYKPYSVFVAPNGDILPYVCIGKYCSRNSVKLNSVSTGTLVDIAIGNARTAAQANGTGYQQYDWQFHILYRDLCLLNAQKVFFPDYNGLSSYLGVDNIDAIVHVDGVSCNGTTYRVATDPANYVNQATSSTTGYRAIGYSIPSSGSTIQVVGYDANCPFFSFPKTLGSYDAYHYYCNSMLRSSGNHPLQCWIGTGGRPYGIWYCMAYYDWSGSYKARLCYRPISETT